MPRGKNKRGGPPKSIATKPGTVSATSIFYQADSASGRPNTAIDDDDDDGNRDHAVSSAPARRDTDQSVEREPLLGRGPSDLRPGPSETTAADARPPVSDDAEGLEQLADRVLNGAISLRDGLSEPQRRLVAAMQHEMSKLNALQAEVRAVEQAIEAQIDAAIGPAIPYYRIVGLQPDFEAPAPQSHAEVEALRRSLTSHVEQGQGPLASQALEERLRHGLVPASDLPVGARTLGADTTEGRVVSVNAFPPVRDSERARDYATYATLNKANGAIPIAVELGGDAARFDAHTLHRRAFDSVMLLIDGSRLSSGGELRIQQASDTGGSETGVDSVPPQAIVGLIAPAHMAPELARLELPVHYVGAKQSSVYHTGSEEEGALWHPDYESGLVAIFEANPIKTLVTHVTRLGTPQPIRPLKSVPSELG